MEYPVVNPTLDTGALAIAPPSAGAHKVRWNHSLAQPQRDPSARSVSETEIQRTCVTPRVEHTNKECGKRTCVRIERNRENTKPLFSLKASRFHAKGPIMLAQLQQLLQQPHVWVVVVVMELLVMELLVLVSCCQSTLKR